MTIPAPTFPWITVAFIRPLLFSYLADSDGVPLVDVDGSRFAIAPVLQYGYDFTHRVLSGSLDLGDVQAVGSSHAGVDAPVQVLSLTLDGGEPSLLPGVASPLNSPDDLIRPYRRVEVRASSGGNEEGERLFIGYLGDELRTRSTAEGVSVTVRARDLAKPLQDMFIADWPVLAATASPATPVDIEDVLLEMLALVPEPRRPVLMIPTTGFEIRYPYRPENQSIWDAAQQLTLQAGGVLRFIGPALTFVLPPRPEEFDINPPPEYRYTTDDVFIDDLGRSDTDIRNVVTVAYRDRETGERLTVTARDQWSIDNLTGGIEKASIIEVDATSQIDTAAEAQTLADRFINDMAAEFVSTQLTLPFTPKLQLFDIVQITNPLTGYQARRFAVHSIRHSWEGGTYRTIIAGVGKVVGRRRSWLDLEPRAGSPNDPRGPHQSVLPAPEFSLYRDFAGFTLVIADTGVQVRHYEIHWSTTSGFTPSAATLRATIDTHRATFRNWLDASAPDYITLTDHHVRVRAVDERGNAGEYADEQTVLPGILPFMLLGG